MGILSGNQRGFLKEILRSSLGKSMIIDWDSLRKSIGTPCQWGFLKEITGDFLRKPARIRFFKEAGKDSLRESMESP